MGVTLERDDGAGIRRRELTADDLALLERLVADDIAATPVPAEDDRRRMLLHWLRPDGG